MLFLVHALVVGFNCDKVDFAVAKGCKVCETFKTGCPDGYELPTNFQNQTFCRKRCNSTAEECFEKIKTAIEGNTFNVNFQNAWVADDNGVLYENHAGCDTCTDCETWDEQDLLTACETGFRSFHVKTECAAASRMRREELRTQHQYFREKDDDDDDTMVIVVAASASAVVVFGVGYIAYKRYGTSTTGSFFESLM